MSAAKIKSKSTYHMVISDLANFGYLEYRPSYHPGTRSQFTFLESSTMHETDTGQTELNSEDFLTHEGHTYATVLLSHGVHIHTV